MRENKFNLKDATGTYYSFQDFAIATGREPAKKRTDDMNKLKAQQEKFAGKCKVCGQDLTYHYGTNVLTCTNVKCKGIEKRYPNDDGIETVRYIPVTRMVDSTGMEIALNIFS